MGHKFDNKKDFMEKLKELFENGYRLKKMEIFLPHPDHDVEHLLLQVNGNHLPALPDKLCHSNGEIAHAAADIHNGHAGFNIITEHGRRVMEEPPQWVIECVSVPPWADVMRGHSDTI